jgi:hypothetical protein
MTTEVGTKRNLPAVAFGAPAAERPEWALSDERLPLFSYTDEEGAIVEVTMPAKPNPSLALRFLRRARQIGPEVAIAWLIEEAIGVAGMDALEAELAKMPDPENGVNVMAAIGEKVQRVVMGGLDGPKG